MNLEERVLEHNLKASSESKKAGYYTMFTALYGSQNYNLDTEDSDVDTKTLIVPSFKALCLNDKQFTKDFDFNGEVVEVKDFRAMFNCFRKQNLNYVEILFSDQVIISGRFYKETVILLSHALDIAHYNETTAVNCMMGIIYRYYKHLFIPFESRPELYKKFGYDPKALYHMYRVMNQLILYLARQKNYLYFDNSTRNVLLDMKEGKYTKKQVEELAENCLSRTAEIVNKSMKDLRPKDKKVDELLLDLQYQILSKVAREDLEDEQSFCAR